MASPETPPLLQSDTTSTNTDSDTTPRAKRQALRVKLSPPPPHPRSDDEPLYHDNDEFEEQENQWRESQPLLHAPSARDEENGLSERGEIRRQREERDWRRREDIHLDDWMEWIGIWLLTCMVIMALSGAAAVLWILVTQ